MISTITHHPPPSVAHKMLGMMVASPATMQRSVIQHLDPSQRSGTRSDTTSKQQLPHAPRHRTGAMTHATRQSHVCAAPTEEQCFQLPRQPEPGTKNWPMSATTASKGCVRAYMCCLLKTVRYSRNDSPQFATCLFLQHVRVASLNHCLGVVVGKTDTQQVQRHIAEHQYRSSNIGSLHTCETKVSDTWAEQAQQHRTYTLQRADRMPRTRVHMVQAVVGNFILQLHANVHQPRQRPSSQSHKVPCNPFVVTTCSRSMCKQQPPTTHQQSTHRSETCQTATAEGTGTHSMRPNQAVQCWHQKRNLIIAPAHNMSQKHREGGRSTRRTKRSACCYGRNDDNRKDDSRSRGPLQQLETAAARIEQISQGSRPRKPRVPLR